MGIKIPGYRIVSKWDLPNLRNHLGRGTGKGGSKRNLDAELTLTSLIDMFSVIIIFLMQTFSATGDVLIRNADIQLPAAVAGRELRRSPIVTIMPDKVSIEGFAVGENANIEERIEETDWELPELQARLQEYKRFFESVHQGVPFSGEVIVQADKGLDFIYLKRVMYTLTKIGFVNINLVVQGAAAGPAIEKTAEPSGG